MRVVGVIIFGISVAMVAVSFHPRWRDAVRWGNGRGRRAREPGVPMSPVGQRLFAAMFCLMGCMMALQPRGWAAAAPFAAYVAAFVGTGVVWYRDRRRDGRDSASRPRADPNREESG